MNRERLEHLITVLERVPDESFDMSRWGYEVGVKRSALRAPTGEYLDPKDSVVTCGTVCCAAGWATQDPEFQRQGLRGVRSLASHLEGYEPMFGTHYDKPALGFRALMIFFGLTNPESEAIFSPCGYKMLCNSITPGHVVANIRSLLAGDNLPLYA